MSEALEIKIPVVCQNGHKAFWYCSIYDLDIHHKGVPDDEKCSCPKFNLGDGYEQDGNPIVISKSPQWTDSMKQALDNCENLYQKMLDKYEHLPQPKNDYKTQLEAWQEAFGTTQLTHALDRLESAERLAKPKNDWDVEAVAKFIFKLLAKDWDEIFFIKVGADIPGEDNPEKALADDLATALTEHFKKPEIDKKGLENAVIYELKPYVPNLCKRLEVAETIVKSIIIRLNSGGVE